MVKAIKKAIDFASFNLIVLKCPTKICMCDSCPHGIWGFSPIRKGLAGKYANRDSRQGIEKLIRAHGGNCVHVD